MKSERNIPFLFFIVCLIATVPFAWGAFDLKGPDGAESVDQAERLRRAPLVRVPKTGETTCTDANGFPISCAGSGQDGEYQKGASVDARFTDNADGTVSDNLTGLIWLKDANCIGYQDWDGALVDSNTLASGDCGLTDGSVAGAWRLPNLKELQSLIDLGQFNPALPVGHPFAGVQPDGYWTSTTYSYYQSHAWYVYLFDGYVSGLHKILTYNVWPVRGGP